MDSFAYISWTHVSSKLHDYSHLTVSLSHLQLASITLLQESDFYKHLFQAITSCVELSSTSCGEMCKRERKLIANIGTQL